MEFLNVYVNVNLVSTYIFSLYQYWYKIFCFLLYPISSMLCNATYFIALPRCLWNWSNRYNSVVNQKQTVFLQTIKWDIYQTKATIYAHLWQIGMALHLVIFHTIKLFKNLIFDFLNCLWNIVHPCSLSTFCCYLV